MTSLVQGGHVEELGPLGQDLVAEPRRHEVDPDVPGHRQLEEGKTLVATLFRRIPLRRTWICRNPNCRLCTDIAKFLHSCRPSPNPRLEHLTPARWVTARIQWQNKGNNIFCCTLLQLSRLHMYTHMYVHTFIVYQPFYVSSLLHKHNEEKWNKFLKKPLNVWNGLTKIPISY
jgi:hypothetical protein